MRFWMALSIKARVLVSVLTTMDNPVAASTGCGVRQ